MPKNSFLETCQYLGAPESRKRWRNGKGDRLYEWDSQHGEIEVYTSRGRHLGAMDPSGAFIKGPVKGWRIKI